MGNREALLSGAKQSLLEKGYDRSTVRDITAAAGGVSMAAIGYHFGSREALLTAASHGGSAFGRNQSAAVRLTS
jgi:AcrR family transcriptional regulator